MTLNFVGVDYSAARQPNMYVTWGVMEQEVLRLIVTYRVADSLELALFIRPMREADSMLWTGLDCPFSTSQDLMCRLGAKSWRELLELAARTPRLLFLNLLEGTRRYYEDHERKCGTMGFCRHTDQAVKGYGVLKRINPNLGPMFHSGLQVLYTAHLLDSRIYPYDPEVGRANLLEVYPSHTWALLGMKRSTDVGEFVRRFNARGELQVCADDILPHVQTQDAADSVVACVTVAACTLAYDLGATWSQRPPFANDEEWAHRANEGLVVRLQR
ncbi:MAG: hypothetical protein NZ750_00765 [Anaerolineae bacterium]|nr:hypothetical protein [Anaerolineae bacterium]MDW8173116.1 hypothetical protein [Anaerolineae bacterium]